MNSVPGYPIVAVPTRQTVVWTVVGRTHVASVLFPFHALGPHVSPAYRRSRAPVAPAWSAWRHAATARSERYAATGRRRRLYSDWPRWRWRSSAHQPPPKHVIWLFVRKSWTKLTLPSPSPPLPEVTSVWLTVTANERLMETTFENNSATS